MISIIVPMYNEEDRLPYSFRKWRENGLLDVFDFIMVDDGSTDKTAEIAQALSSGHAKCSVVSLGNHRSKMDAISEALSIARESFVLCLDADTWFPGRAEDLAEELRLLVDSDVDVVAFVLKPLGPSLVARLQQVEYLFFSDVARRLFGFTGNVNGAVSLWRSDVLRQVLSCHSMDFEGDDLEATLLAYDLDARIARSGIQFSKMAKSTLRSLIRQRAYVWDIGLLRVFAHFGLRWKSRHADELFLRWYFIYEVLLHPVKVLSLIIVILHGLCSGTCELLVVCGSLACMIAYMSALILSLVMWLFCDGNYIDRYRVLGALAVFSLYPTLHLWIMAISKIVVAETSLSVAALSFLWWMLVCVAFSLALSGWRARVTAIGLSSLMPFYYLFLVVFIRSLGFLIWFKGIARRRGKY